VGGDRFSAVRANALGLVIFTQTHRGRWGSDIARVLHQMQGLGVYANMTDPQSSLADRYFEIEPGLIGALMAISAALSVYLLVLVGQSAGL